MTAETTNSSSLEEAGTDGQVLIGKESGRPHRGLLGKEVVEPDGKGEHSVGSGYPDLRLVEG